MLTLPCQPLSLIGYPRQPELYIDILSTECFALPLIKCATGVTSKAFITGPSYNSFITFQWFIWKLVMTFPGRQEFVTLYTNTHKEEKNAGLKHVADTEPRVPGSQIQALTQCRSDQAQVTQLQSVVAHQKKLLLNGRARPGSSAVTRAQPLTGSVPALQGLGYSHCLTPLLPCSPWEWDWFRMEEAITSTRELFLCQLSFLILKVWIPRMHPLLFRGRLSMLAPIITALTHAEDIITFNILHQSWSPCASHLSKYN